jgi:hypothetical protein
MSFWSSALGWITRETVKAVPPSVTVGKVTVTRGQAVSALKGIPALAAAIKHLVEGTATLSDDDLIGEDVLAVAGAIAATNPEASAAVAIAAVLAPLIIEGVASGAITIKPDPDPEVDANAYSGRGGRGN